MRDITPLHQQPDAIPEPWKRQPLREPVFSHPLAISGYRAYPSVKHFAADVTDVIRQTYDLASEADHEGVMQNGDDFRAVAREYTAWAREEGLI